MDIVQQFGLDRKYGMGVRGITDYINKLVRKGKVDKKYVVEAEKIRRVRQDKDVKGSPAQNQQSILQRVLVVKECLSQQNKLVQDTLIKICNE